MTGYRNYIEVGLSSLSEVTTPWLTIAELKNEYLPEESKIGSSPSGLYPTPDSSSFPKSTV